jgi:hypothetical protein
MFDIVDAAVAASADLAVFDVLYSILAGVVIGAREGHRRGRRRRRGRRDSSESPLLPLTGSMSIIDRDIRRRSWYR